MSGIPAKCLRSILQVGTGVLAIGLATSTAFAQDAAPAPASATANEAPADASDIIVTGSRVERAGYSAPTPVTVVGSQLLVERAPSVLIDALKLLPAARNTSTPTTGGNAIAGSGGGSFLNLRGLGPNRTLILLNGQRMIPTSNIGTVDLAVLPQSLVKRIDVVTGGASAAYGSDAVAGVANFALDTELKGLRANVEAGISSHGDAGTRKVSAAWGGDLGDRLHVVVGGEYYRGDEAPLTGRNDLEYPVATVPNPNFTTTNGQKSLIVAPYVYFNNMTNGGLILTTKLANTQFLPGGVTAPYVPCGPVTGTSQVCPTQRDDLVFFQRVADLTAPQTRYSGYGALTYEATDRLKLSADFLYGESTTVFHSVPPATSALGAFTIQRDNAYLPASIAAAMDASPAITSFTMGRFSREFGRTEFTRAAKVRRGSLALDADLGGTWKAKGYAAYAVSTFTSRYDNAPITDLFYQTVDAVVNPANNQIVCRSTLTNPTNGCIPINLFGVGSPNLASKAYSYGNALTRLRSREFAAGVTVSGEPFSTWAGPVSVAAGAEYRWDNGHQTVDAIQLARRFAYSNNQPLDGTIRVKEGFFETVVPLAKDMALAKNLELNGAVRVTNYSTSGTVTTWKAGGNYEPFEGLRFRVVRSRDIRAPNILELNSVPVLGSSGSFINDPKNNNALVIFSSYTGGNRFLKPEVANTLSLGVVVQPRFIPGLNISLDYYKIKLGGAIQTLTNQQVLNECQGGNTTLCNFIVRDSTDKLISITSTYANLAKITTSGFDLEASYRVNLGASTLDLRVLGNYLKEYVVDTGTTRVDYAGDILTYGIPKWGWDFGATWRNGGTTVNADLRRLGAGKYSIASASTIENNDIKGMWYVGLGVEQTVATGSRELTVYARVDNLLGQKPPLFFPAANAGGNYDRIGRYFKVGARIKM